MNPAMTACLNIARLLECSRAHCTNQGIFTERPFTPATRSMQHACTVRKPLQALFSGSWERDRGPRIHSADGYNCREGRKALVGSARGSGIALGAAVRG